jgi:MscS family membrane protein
MKQYLLLFLFTIVTLTAFSQDKNRLDKLNSPYSTAYTHLYYLQSESYDAEKAAKTLRNNSKNAEELAIQLKQILDGKGLYVELVDIPIDSNHVDSTTRKRIYKLFPEQLPKVYIQKYGNRWYYSSETIKAIPALHREIYPFGANLIVNLLPKFGQYVFLGLQIWQWLGAVLLIVIAFFAYKLMTLLIKPIIKKILSTNVSKILPENDLIFKIARLLSIILVFISLIRVLPILQLPIDLGLSVRTGLKIVETAFFIFLFLRLVDLAIYYVRELARKTESTLDNQLVPILHTTLNVIVVIGGIIQILTLLEVNVTALIAGVSIGGLAIALAAQDTVKNLLGSLMIFADKPFQIGDLIKVKDVTGTVEVVGFRSTRIRTAGNSVVAIPNGTIANEIIDNLGLRMFRKMDTSIGITYQTSPETIEAFVLGIRNIIEKHPIAKTETFQVHFTNLNASSLDIIINGMLDVRTWGDELKAKQEILLTVIRLAGILNISFAFPSTSVYMEKMDTVSEKKYNSIEQLMADFEQQFEEKV